MEYIKRAITQKILEASQFFPVIVVTGPRQSGKTTLCREIFPDYRYVNLEDLTLRSLAKSDPVGFISQYGPRVIIDEVQNVPKLLSQVQVEVDKDPETRFVVTGSSNFSLLSGVTQSLAGRAAVFTLLPLAFDELGAYPKQTPTDELIFKGFYPGVLCREIPPEMFYSNYYATYVERDIRQLANLKHLDTFQLFIRLCAGRIGTEFRPTNLSNEVGVSVATIKEWLSLLMASYIVFLLPPFYANINKTLTKAKKLYFYDVGLASYLIGIENSSQLTTHPLRGPLFENMAVMQMLKKRYNLAKSNDLSYYRENSGREVDLVQRTVEGLDLYEVKSAATFHESFLENMRKVAALLPDVKAQRVVYDGELLLPDILNIRQI